MHRKYLAAALVALLVVGVATVALAQFRGPRGGHKGGGFGLWRELGLAHFEARLNLTPEQSQQVQNIVRSEKAKAFQQVSGGADNRMALAKEIFKDNPSQAQIQERVQALMQQHAAMLNHVVAAGLEVNKVFTPEQRAELQKMLDERAQVAGKMREKARERMAQPAPQQ